MLFHCFKDGSFPLMIFIKDIFNIDALMLPMDYGNEGCKMSRMITRRQFLQGSTATVASIGLASGLGFSLEATAAEIKGLRTKNVKPTPTVCPYCGSGCGLLVYSQRDAGGKFVKLLSIQAIRTTLSTGAACPKGSAMFNLRKFMMKRRTGNQPQKGAEASLPGSRSDKWEEKDWDWMLDRIAEKVKETRDKSFITRKK
jgi:formate dehydrogenase major subunit